MDLLSARDNLLLADCKERHVVKRISVIMRIITLALVVAAPVASAPSAVQGILQSGQIGKLSAVWWQ